MERILTEPQNTELDRLWEELHFVTQSAEATLRGFVWFERTGLDHLQGEEYDFVRAEDPNLVETEFLKRFETVYLSNQDEDKHEMIQSFFEQIRQNLALRVEQESRAEQHGLADLNDLAARAWSRPLTDAESEGLHRLYRTLREQDQSVEDALRGCFASILMSPEFAFRYSEAMPGEGARHLSNAALAKRLSYFLWSSLPDAELLSVNLHDEAVLREQTRRMSRSPKIAAFAREFPAQWLRYRDFLEKNPINAEAFPEYTPELQAAMFEEPARLVEYLIQEDRSVLELLDSDSTFVNRDLAIHYGLPVVNEWSRIEGLRGHGRGGLLGMGVILTANSAGERTSPVKRGFWTVHHLLGKHFPPPPADVPELPLGEREAPETIRVMMARHAADASCAMCHKHFDSLGLAMEGFDPIGRTRIRDLAGRAIDNVAELPNGDSAQGLPGLIDYVSQHRRDDFIDTLCRKFLGYALGRSVILSDQQLLDQMASDLSENEYRFSTLFETVVTSQQFRQRRGDD